MSSDWACARAQVRAWRDDCQWTGLRYRWTYLWPFAGLYNTYRLETRQIELNGRRNVAPGSINSAALAIVPGLVLE